MTRKKRDLTRQRKDYRKLRHEKLVAVSLGEEDREILAKLAVRIGGKKAAVVEALRALDSQQATPMALTNDELLRILAERLETAPKTNR